MQNAAARLLTNTHRRVHITPVLNSLHWLPVLFRIDFKLIMLVFKALNSLAPLYLSELLTIRDPGRALRSTNQLVLEVPRSKYKHWGDQAFSVAAPRLWNKLPTVMRLISDPGLFKSRLKTYLFRLFLYGFYYPEARWHFYLILFYFNLFDFAVFYCSHLFLFLLLSLYYYTM